MMALGESTMPQGLRRCSVWQASFTDSLRLTTDRSKYPRYYRRCLRVNTRAAIEPEVLEPRRSRPPPPPPPPAPQRDSDVRTPQGLGSSSRRTLLGAGAGALLLGIVGFNEVFNQQRDDRTPYPRESLDAQTAAFQQPPRTPNREEIAAVLTSPNGRPKYIVRKLPTPSTHVFLQDRERCYILTMPFLVDSSDEAAVKRAVSLHVKEDEGEALAVTPDYYEWLLTKEAPTTTAGWMVTELVQKFGKIEWD